MPSSSVVADEVEDADGLRRLDLQSEWDAVLQTTARVSDRKGCAATLADEPSDRSVAKATARPKDIVKDAWTDDNAELQPKRANVRGKEIWGEDDAVHDVCCVCVADMLHSLHMCCSMSVARASMYIAHILQDAQPKSAMVVLRPPNHGVVDIDADDDVDSPKESFFIRRTGGKERVGSLE